MACIYCHNLLHSSVASEVHFISNLGFTMDSTPINLLPAKKPGLLAVPSPSSMKALLAKKLGFLLIEGSGPIDYTKAKL